MANLGSQTGSLEDNQPGGKPGFETSWIELSRQALLSNVNLLSKRSKDAIFAPVVKANAYGHGIKEVYEILRTENLPWLCVNYLYEASQLRSIGYRGRIMVVGPATLVHWAEAASQDVDLVVGNVDVLRAWLEHPRPGRIHLKFDTGMGRQGFAPSEASSVAESIRSHNRLGLVAGVCTHFANVEDVTDQSYALTQIARFRTAQEPFLQLGQPILFHCASSASTLIMEQSHFNLVRVGISLYGLWPSSLTRVSCLQQHQQLVELQPVLSWFTRISTLKKVPKGQFIGYGCSYRAVRDMKVAVLPVGYYEGYPRIAGEGSSFVLIEGQRCPVVGRLCMNMMMVDVTHLEPTQAGVGTLVTLIGKDGGETITAQDVATWAKTIHYEVMSRLHPDTPRHIV